MSRPNLDAIHETVLIELSAQLRPPSTRTRRMSRVVTARYVSSEYRHICRRNTVPRLGAPSHG